MRGRYCQRMASCVLHLDVKVMLSVAQLVFLLRSHFSSGKDKSQTYLRHENWKLEERPESISLLLFSHAVSYAF